MFLKRNTSLHTICLMIQMVFYWNRTYISWD